MNRMNENLVDVIYENKTISLFHEVALKYSLKRGAVISTEPLFWEILKANALVSIRKCLAAKGGKQPSKN